MKKRKAGELERSKSPTYLNVDYISGSAAEVKPLWSSCKYIITNTRSRLTPNLFEVLVFLKVNHDCWDARSIQLAYTKALKLQTDRAREMIDEDDLYDVNVSDDE